MSTIIEMQVHMDCAGCENKIRKALQKIDGVDDIEIDMELQKVTVTGSVEQKKVLKAVRKTGRTVELWPFQYNPNNYYSFSQQYYRTQQEHYLNPLDGGLDMRYYSYNYHISNKDEQVTSSSAYSYYDYYKNGYQNPQYSTIVMEQASSMLSDENSNSCSIM